MAEKTLKVEGMMCQHCERHVKEALEKIDGVDSAVANHETNSVLVQLSKDVAEADFEKAVTDAGYTYVKQKLKIGVINFFYNTFISGDF